ncbi:MAG: hypothetical protein IPL50_16300 [Chitinophagaceae bacterium]|nr:hypothetical protein [Chitinophagaceae bacterium]
MAENFDADAILEFRVTYKTTCFFRMINAGIKEKVNKIIQKMKQVYEVWAGSIRDLQLQQ